MRSRAARLTTCTIVWLILGASAYSLFHFERQISQRRERLRAFDVHVREAVEALADVRGAQQAYVARGQGVVFWMPKVSALVNDATFAVDGVRASAASAAALGSLAEADRTIAEFVAVDQRAREYLGSNEELMASDVVFTEGGETARAAMRRIEEAALAEHQAFDAFEAAQRRLEAGALGGAAGLSALMVALLAFGARPAPAVAGLGLSLEATRNPDELLIRDVPKHAPRPAADSSARSASALRSAASLCTEFGRLKDVDDLTKLLAEAAALMEASGLIVWLGNSSGGDLRPVMAHGYTAQVLQRMPVVPRTADNAAAAAYRTGSLQIVLSRPGSSSGAIVAPLLTPDGCIGALAAEIKGGGEASDSVQALAAIVAAQLGAVMGQASSIESDSVQRAANS